MHFMYLVCGILPVFEMYSVCRLHFQYNFNPCLKYRPNLAGQVFAQFMTPRLAK